ncbi:cytochrome p450 monooxygenase [Hypoxylon rubiginosum]|uniref:Cytochrome p450 monooxygenase n=1 Tax=Hypoxylon rubiginosum TaxID=110542 RepID=A0ACB9YGY8_9PEZI|nr:cytochrome p450 monooxygenase [Hypoxylon rubiginosum]
MIDLRKSGDHQTRDNHGYGVGRRICLGIHLAQRGLWLAVARLLWAFEVWSKLDAIGKAILIDMTPETGCREGFLNQCLSFGVDIKVRSEERRATILRETAKAEAEVFTAPS